MKLSPFTLSLIIFTTISAVAAEKMKLFDFNESDSHENWVAVNDGVMGGLSQGAPSFEDGNLIFSGSLSLENNGGFSSIRNENDLDLSDFNTVRMRVKGDGRRYQLRFQTDQRFRESPVSYSYEFEATKGEWIEVDAPFSELKQSFRGMELVDNPFDPAKVEQIGILIGDKKPGPFSLAVTWITAGKATR